MIDPKVLRQLVKLMVDNDLSELDLQEGDEKVKLKRGPQGGPVLASPVAAAPAAAPVAAAAPASAPAASASSDADDDGGEPAETIDSPMVGSFYSKPSPDAKAYVSVGSQVDADTVVCIIEAMKVFNEIKAEKAGVIKKILVTDGTAVEFDQPLFEIEPA